MKRDKSQNNNAQRHTCMRSVIPQGQHQVGDPDEVSTLEMELF
jgi:hypothetical protein